MASEKSVLIEQFAVCYEENGWFVALKNALKGLTAEQAGWRTENLENSIWGILSHLNFYNERYLLRFKGEPVPELSIENRETFSGAEGQGWQAEIERFDAIMSEWMSLLEAADVDKFDEPVSETDDSPWGSVIGHINLHNAHHGGQIVLLRKLQGSWDASRGVS